MPLSARRLRTSEIIGAVILLAGVTALSVAQAVTSALEIVGASAPTGAAKVPYR